MVKTRSRIERTANSDAQLTKDVLAHIINGAKYQDLQSAGRTVRKYVGIYYDVIIDELNDCARSAFAETPGGQLQTFHPVVPTEAERRRSTIPEALYQFIEMDHLEEVVSFFGKAGRPAALCPDEEKRLYHYAVYRVQRNMPLLKQDFLRMVSKYLSDTGRTRTITLTRKRECSSGHGVKSKESRTMLSKNWLPAFNRRMEKQGLTSLVLRLPSTLERSREYAFNKENVDEFFGDLETAYARAGITSPADAWRVINMDETGVQGDQESKLRVLAPRGTKRVQMAINSERNHVTMINAISAAGTAFRPMMVYSNTGPSLDYMQEVLLKKDPELKICRSEKGWIDSTLFVEFLEDLKSQLPAERRDAKIILIVDGHSSHTTMEAVEWCCANNWELVTFPAHCTHKMQPLDVECYKTVKNAFRYEKQRMGEQGIDVGKHVLLQDGSVFRLTKGGDVNTHCLLNAWKNVSPMHVERAFQVTGLFPLRKNTFEAEFAKAEQAAQQAVEMRFLDSGCTTAGPHSSNTASERPEDDDTDDDDDHNDDDDDDDDAEGRKRAAVAVQKQRQRRNRQRGVLSASAGKALKKPRGKTTSFCLTAQEAVAFMRNKVADENQRRTEKEAKAQKRQQSATRNSSVSTVSRPPNAIHIRSYNGGEGSSTSPYVPASQQPAAEAAGTVGIQPTGLLSSIQAANRRFAQN
eukprot:ANDGO_07425.mRNA.1 hypothetical protein CAOG_08509